MFMSFILLHAELSDCLVGLQTCRHISHLLSWIWVPLQCGSFITLSMSPEFLEETPHSPPSRASYGVSPVSSEWDVCSTFAICSMILKSTVRQWWKRTLLIGLEWNKYLNTLRPRQNGRHFPDNSFQCIFLNENIWTLIKIWLKFIP